MQGSKKLDFDLNRYWSLVIKKRYLALSIGIAVLSAFTWGSFFMTYTYEASSTVLMEKSSIMEPLIKGVGVANTGEDITHIKNNISSRNLLEKVAAKMGVAIDVNSSLFEDYLNRVRNHLTVRSFGGPGADLFTVSFTGKDPEMITRFVNVLVNEYIIDSVSSKVSDATEAYNFIQSQLLEYKKRLEDSDKATREFREKNPTLIPVSEAALASRTESFQSQRIETDIKIKELLRKHDNLQRQLSGEKELTVAFVTREGSPQSRLDTLNNQLLFLMTKYTDNYPEVIKVRREIEELKRQIALAKDKQNKGAFNENAGSETAAINPIYQQLKEELAKTDAEVESLRARSAELSRQREEAQTILGRMPKEQEEWTKLERDRNVYQKIYDDLLQKLETARVSKDLKQSDTDGNFKIVDPAKVPHMPIKPNRIKMILTGLFLGIMAAIAAVIGLDYLNQSFKDEATLESGLNLPVLAVIPRILTEKDRAAEKKLDRKIFSLASIYLCVIAFILVEEISYRYLGIRLIMFLHGGG